MDATTVARETSALFALLMQYGPPIVGAMLVLFVGWTVANWVRSIVAKGLDKTRVDSTLKPLLASIARYIVLGITLIVVMQQFGVQTASLIALIGTIGIAIGLALQGTLSNVAAGLMLLFLRPFEVGDHVEAGGSEGIVLGIDLFHTNLRTVEGVDVVIPNGSILSGSIKNMSGFPERVIASSFTVSGNAVIGEALAMTRAAIEADPRVQKERGVVVSVKALGGGGAPEINFTCWVRNEDYRDARTAILADIKTRFEAAKIVFG